MSFIKVPPFPATLLSDEDEVVANEYYVDQVWTKYTEIITCQLLDLKHNFIDQKTFEFHKEKFTELLLISLVEKDLSLSHDFIKSSYVTNLPKEDIGKMWRLCTFAKIDTQLNYPRAFETFLILEEGLKKLYRSK